MKYKVIVVTLILVLLASVVPIITSYAQVGKIEVTRDLPDAAIPDAPFDAVLEYELENISGAIISECLPPGVGIIKSSPKYDKEIPFAREIVPPEVWGEMPAEKKEWLEKYGGTVYQWLKYKREGIGGGEITYTAKYSPKDTLPKLLFSGWTKATTLEGVSIYGFTQGDQSISFYISDEDLLRAIGQWAKGEVSDEELLRLIATWATGGEAPPSPTPTPTPISPEIEKLEEIKGVLEEARKYALDLVPGLVPDIDGTIERLDAAIKYIKEGVKEKALSSKKEALEQIKKLLGLEEMEEHPFLGERFKVASERLEEAISQEEVVPPPPPPVERLRVRMPPIMEAEIGEEFAIPEFEENTKVGVKLEIMSAKRIREMFLTMIEEGEPLDIVILHEEGLAHLYEIKPDSFTQLNWLIMEFPELGTWPIYEELLKEEKPIFGLPLRSERYFAIIPKTSRDLRLSYEFIATLAKWVHPLGYEPKPIKIVELPPEPEPPEKKGEVVKIGSISRNNWYIGWCGTSVDDGLRIRTVKYKGNYIIYRADAPWFWVGRGEDVKRYELKSGDLVAGPTLTTYKIGFKISSTYKIKGTTITEDFYFWDCRGVFGEFNPVITVKPPRIELFEVPIRIDFDIKRFLGDKYDVYQGTPPTWVKKNTELLTPDGPPRATYGYKVKVYDAGIEARVVPTPSDKAQMYCVIYHDSPEIEYHTGKYLTGEGINKRDIVFWYNAKCKLGTGPIHCFWCISYTGGKTTVGPYIHIW